MPSDGNFGFSVLVGGLPVTEYRLEDRVLIESDLWTPTSYKQLVKEVVYGEVEEQEWPVTPYQIKLSVEPHCPISWYDVYVDGSQVAHWVLDGGQSKCVAHNN